MPVYSYKTLQPIIDELDYAAARFFSRMPLILTKEEAHAAFIRQEHIDALQTAVDIVGGFNAALPMPCVDTGAHGKVSLSIRSDLYRGLPIPRYAENGLSPDCPPEVEAKIMAWVKERINLGLQFNIVRDALRELNDLCYDAGTFRAMVPCLPYLMSRVSVDPESTTAKRASKVASTRSVGRVPMLLREVKDKILDAAGVVGSVALIDESPEPAFTNGQVVLSYHPRAQEGYCKSVNIFDGDSQYKRITPVI